MSSPPSVMNVTCWFGLHALAGENLEQTAFGLGVVGLHEPERLGRAVVGHRLAGDHLKPAVAARALLAAMDVGAVEADDERQVRARQILPGGGAAVDEAAALVAELVLEALRDSLGVQTHSGGVQRATEGEDVGEQLRRQAVGDEACELSLEVPELRGGALRDQGGERTERPGLMDGARAVPPTRTRQAQCAEQAAHHDLAGVFVPASLAAVRAGDLRREGAAHLLLDDRALDGAEQILGLVEVKPEGVRCQRPACQREHLVDHGGRGVVGFEGYPHGDLHAARSSLMDSPARAWLSARRSNRSISSHGRRHASSSR
jgi:hypothetical protein